MHDLRTSRRFPVQLPVRITMNGTETTGTTDNISAAGCYLYMDQALDAGASVRFAIDVPGAYIGSRQNTSVLCEGVVKRTDVLPNGVFGLACMIDSYEIVRDKKKR
jgi:hypothetical protein